MRATPKTDWFLTETGRNFVFGSVIAGATSCVLARFLPNTIFLTQYQELVSSYRDGLPVPVGPKVLDRVNKVFDILEISKWERKFIKPFTVFGFDILSAGSTLSKWGAILGIPENFSFESKDTIDKRRIQVNNDTTVDWTREESQQLLDSLVLSENAQMFAIAREIEEKRSAKLLLDTSFAPLIMISMYSLGRYYNEKLNHYSRPRLLRLIFYSIIGLFGTGFYCFMKDFTQVHYDTKLDQELAEKNPLFVYGGLEYYQKTIERNKALRKLLGKTGEQMYSVYGNENFFIRNKRLPLNVRRLYFETKSAEILGKKAEDVM